MFPGSNARVDYNEAGEPVGWDYPDFDTTAYYCDVCGFDHTGPCTDDYDDDYEEYDEWSDEP
jgi:hypothetical protein